MKTTTAFALVAACFLMVSLAASAHGARFFGLGDLPGGTFNSWANGVSADGSVVVGISESGSGGEAFRWTSGEGMVGLGYLSFLPFGKNSFARGVSADGSVIVGDSSGQAFRWTSEDGMVGL